MNGIIGEKTKVKRKQQKKSSGILGWIKFLVKVLIFSWLFYSLFFIACEKSSDSCPLPKSLLEHLKLEKYPIVQQNYDRVVAKLQEYQEIVKSNDIGLQVSSLIDQFTFYFDKSAAGFVHQVLPFLAKYLHQGLEKLKILKEFMVDTGIPWLRTQVKTGAKFMRSLFKEYYPRDFVKLVSNQVSERFSSFTRVIYNLEMVQNLLKNEKLMENYGKIMDYTQDLRSLVAENVKLWFVEYPSLGFDFFWRFLEDDVSVEEYDKIGSVLKRFVSFA